MKFDKPDEYYLSLDKRTKEYKEWKSHIDSQSTGLGDDIEKVTKATGIKKAVDFIFDKMGKDCGCDKRKEKLNKLFPRKKAPLCLEEEEFNFINTIKGRLNSKTRQRMSEIHARIFQHKYFEPCTCSPVRWQEWTDDLKKAAQAYQES